jgi:indolepyruvate ferredoxin oxidoreductase, alpha subunit
LRKLLTGSEAVAQGALECGVHVAAVSSGPVSDDVEAALRRGGEVRCERVPSEATAVELAMGAALGCARSLALVRAGGLEAAAAALQAASGFGVSGLVLVACDDPGARVAPDGDSRLAARAALVPVLEPADPREVRVFVGEALELSERFDTPVLVRLTTRLADSAAPVDTVPRRAAAPRGLRVETASRALARGPTVRRARALERLASLAAHGWDTPLNRIEKRSADLGVVVSGLAYEMVREALPEASILKLGLVHPVPTGLVRVFAGQVRRLLVVEELEPFLESELRAAGIACEGKDRLARSGELTPELLAQAFGAPRPRSRPAEPVPERPAELCPGCPQRATLHALKRQHVTVAGELDCARLASLLPLSTVARASGTGAPVAVAAGLEAALGERVAGRAVAVAGEDALLHSGAGALAVAARGRGTVVLADTCVRDRDGRGEEAAESGAQAPVGRRVDLAALVRSLGVAAVRVADPLDLGAFSEVLRQELGRPAFSAIIARSPCASLRQYPRPPQRVDPSRCNRCGACLRLGCPAAADGPEAVEIDPVTCAGCGLCAQVCRPGAIGPEVQA